MTNDTAAIEAMARRMSRIPFGHDTFESFLINAYAEQGCGLYSGIEQDVEADIQVLATAALAALREVEGRVGFERECG